MAIESTLEQNKKDALHRELAILTKNVHIEPNTMESLA